DDAALVLRYGGKYWNAPDKGAEAAARPGGRRLDRVWAVQRTDTTGSPAGYRWVRPAFIQNPWLRWGLLLLSVGYLMWAVSTLSISWDRVAQGLPRAADIFSRAWPPDFSRRNLIVNGFVESIQIAIFATALGILISVPAALLAARNLVPRAVYLVGRGLIIVARSFHPVIVAILFVKAVGFG